MLQVERLERQYTELKSKLEAGAISPQEFRAEATKLWFEDAQGRTWLIGAQTGRWYFYEDGAWSPGEPPRTETPSEVVACLRCGQLVEADAAFCGYCGFRLPAPRPVSRAMPTPPTPDDSPAKPDQPSQAAAAPPAGTAGAGRGANVRWIAIAAGLFVCLIGAGALLAVNQNAANSLVAPVSPTPRAADLIPPTPSATTAALTPTPTVQPPTDTPRLPTATPRPPTLTPTPVAPLTGHIVYSVFNPQYTDLKAYDVYISAVDGSDRRLIAPRRRQPQLSPDGRRIALRGMEGGKLNLFILNLQSGVEQLVEHTHEEASLPSWSSDGQLAVFSSSEMPDRAWRLCTINVQRPPENCAWLKVGPYVLLGRYPTWMANGQIVYSGCNYYWGTTGECGLIRVNADGSSPALITAEPQDGVDTAPANAGETVLFMSRRDGNWEIYKVPLAGGKATNLTKNPADDGLPALSPDEKFIAFVSNRSGQWAVWAMRTDGSDARLLFPLGGGYSVEPDMDFMTERISWGP